MIWRPLYGPIQNVLGQTPKGSYKMTIDELDNLMKALECLPTTGDFRFDQAIGLAHDRLLMMWAEAARAERDALDAANVPEVR